MFKHRWTPSARNSHTSDARRGHIFRRSRAFLSWSSARGAAPTRKAAETAAFASRGFACSLARMRPAVGALEPGPRAADEAVVGIGVVVVAIGAAVRLE